jgi:hypothetical protein
LEIADKERITGLEGIVNVLRAIVSVGVYGLDLNDLLFYLNEVYKRNQSEPMKLSVDLLKLLQMLRVKNFIFFVEWWILKYGNSSRYCKLLIEIVCNYMQVENVTKITNCNILMNFFNKNCEISESISVDEMIKYLEETRNKQSKIKYRE